ncbi:MAG: hypothetical protein AB2803_18585 [Candidatus Thiodiazotropha sp.]
MSGLARLLTALSLILLLAACGGGDPDVPWDTSNDSNTQNPDGSTVYLLGNGAGDSFQPGVLNVGVRSLSAGGLTSVIATLADAQGNLFQDDIDISFSSNCTVQGLADMESPVSAAGGVASTNYEAQGCTGTDVITAIATVNGQTVTATGSVTVAAAELGSMQFVSAEPANIGLKGFGLIESSDITFRVLDTNSNPVSNQAVNFSLNTTVGGITMISTSGVSDANGLVRATVNSGTIPTSVRVTASLAANPSISSQSDGVTVSTGISDQNSFSLALSCHSPEGWSEDGEEVVASIYAADHFNNPVPDGTAVYFTTEGGQIEPQCLTADGKCSVTWSSSNPRPINGRATILATMLGEESFIDSVPSNGFMDQGETFFDLAEAFRDDDEDGVYTAFVDEYVDYNADAQYTAADGMYNGILCTDSAVCSEEKNIHVRASQILIMARTNLELDTGGVVRLTSTNKSLESFTATFYGVHGDGSWQVPPGGTKITFEASIGEITTIEEVVVPCSVNGDQGNPNMLEGYFDWSIAWKGGDQDESGTMTIIAEVPSGLQNVWYIELESN